jgi:hypothetical protein
MTHDTPPTDSLGVLAWVLFLRKVLSNRTEANFHITTKHTTTKASYSIPLSLQ